MILLGILVLVYLVVARIGGHHNARPQQPKQ